MYNKPIPAATATSKPFWEGLKAHRVDIQQCDDCGEWIFYPRLNCPACLSNKLSWKHISGKGKLVTYTVARIPTLPEFTDEMPQKLAVVQFDEGPHCNTTLVGLDEDEIKVGMTLKPVFHDVVPGKTTLLRYTGVDKTVDLNSAAEPAPAPVPAPVSNKRQIDCHDLVAMQSLVSETYSAWSSEFTVSQDIINQFAALSGDDYWIHTDPELCKKQSPFGTTIAHGFLVLVLASKMKNAEPDYEVVGFNNMVNYGSDKLRFPSPVPSGSRIRSRSRIKTVSQVKSGIQMTIEICIHVVGMDRPSVINEQIVLYM